MLTKGAIGNLVNRYKAVLKKCNLINTFGSLAVASMLVMGGVSVASAAKIPVTSDGFAISDPADENATGDGAGENLEISLNVAGAGGIMANNKKVVISGYDTLSITRAENVEGLQNCLYVTNGGELDINVKNITITEDAIESAGIHSYGGTTTINVDNFYTYMNTPSILVHRTNDNSNIKIYANEKIIFNSDAVAIHIIPNAESNNDIFLKAKQINIESHNVHGAYISNYYTTNASVNLTIHGEDVVYIEGNDYSVSAMNYDTSNKSHINVDIKSNNVLKIIGAIYGSKSNINITAGGATSIDGDVYIGTSSTMTMNLGGATSIDGYVYADDTSKLSMNLGGATTVETLYADNVTVKLNSGDASLTASSVYGTVTVSGSGAANDAAGGSAEALMAKVSATSGTVKTKFAGMAEGFLYGAVAAGQTAPAKPNSAIEDTLEVANSAPLAIGRIVMNDVRKRMGDLRDASGEAGVWMRWDGGKLAGDEGLTNNFNTIQIGGDMLTGMKNVRAGVAAAFTHGDIDHRNGNGEMETFSFSAYGTWMADNGMFADVIARVGFTNTELNMKGNRIDIDNEALSLSGEFGWRFDVCKSFYVEPQVELTYTYLTSADTKVSYADYSVDSLDSLIGRAGLAAGWKLPDDRGNVYARASVVQEFLGDSKLTASAFGNTMAHSEDGQDTWLEYGIGANVKLTDNTYIWADVERTEGADIDEEWRGTVGVRFSF